LKVASGTDAFVANSAPEALRHCSQWQRLTEVIGPAAWYVTPPHKQLPLIMTSLDVLLHGWLTLL
jgi:hypothetical protein